MTKNEILFWIAISGFFGITGLDLINATIKVVNDLYLQIGSILWVIIISVIFLMSNRKK